MFCEIEERGPVRWMILNRPERHNAIPLNGWGQLRIGFEDFEASGQRVLVVTGEGQSFCSGADLSPDQVDTDMFTNVAARYEYVRLVSQAALALYRVTKPTLAAVNGPAIGAGVGLLLGCDVAIASDRASFGLPFVERALPVDFGVTWLLPRAVGLSRAKELAISGRTVDAAGALVIGLVADVVESEQLAARVQQLAEKMASGAPLAARLTNQGLDRSFDMSFEEALDWETRAQSICLGSEDVREALEAFRSKREPHFRGL